MSGSPDAVVMHAPGQVNYPPAAPRGPGVAGLTAAIQQERAARAQMQHEMGVLQERLQAVDHAMTAPPPPCPAPTGTPSAALASGGGSASAATFADSMRAKSCGEVEQRGNLVIVRLSDAFQPGSERLKGGPSHMTAILAAAEELGATPSAFVEVVGHSDSQPITKSKWRDNVHLSQERAQTVANALAKRGVPSGRLSVTGRGSAEPLVFPEQSAADRARNRRVEIRVQF